MQCGNPINWNRSLEERDHPESETSQWRPVQERCQGNWNRASPEQTSRHDQLELRDFTATREPQSPAEVSSNLKIQQIHASIIIQGRYYDLRLIPPSVTPYNSLPLGGIAVGAPINQRMGISIDTVHAHCGVPRVRIAEIRRRRRRRDCR